MSWRMLVARFVIGVLNARAIADSITADTTNDAASRRRIVSTDTKTSSAPAARGPMTEAAAKLAWIPTVRGYQLRRVHEARDRSELGGCEEDRERRRHERNRVDPPQRENSRAEGQRHGRDRRGGEEIDDDHEPLAVGAIGPRADSEPEEKLRRREDRE